MKPHPGLGKVLDLDQERVLDEVKQVPARKEFIKARVEASVSSHAAGRKQGRAGGGEGS